VRWRFTSDRSEIVQLRSTHDWLGENDIGQVDLLKVDTEGSEVRILFLRWSARSVKVLYVESHSGADRHEIDDMVASTHQLAHVSGVWLTADFTYVRSDLFADAGTGSTSGAAGSAIRTWTC